MDDTLLAQCVAERLLDAALGCPESDAINASVGRTIDCTLAPIRREGNPDFARPFATLLRGFV